MLDIYWSIPAFVYIFWYKKAFTEHYFDQSDSLINIGNFEIISTDK